MPARSCLIGRCDGDQPVFVIGAAGKLQQASGYLSLVGVLGTGPSAYRREAPDVEWSISPPREGQAMAGK